MNQNPEQIARDQIDTLLQQAGWIVQDKKKIDLHAKLGVAVCEYQTDIGYADYVLFVEAKPVGVIEAKREDEGVNFTVHEEQAEGYASAKLKQLHNQPLPFVYLSTGTKTVFTDFRDAKPRAREVFHFHKPETLQTWAKQKKSLRNSFQDLPALPTLHLRECQITAITALEQSFKQNKPRALIQMATGSGKTFTAITFIYRLLKFTKAERVLFLVDTKNLGEQAEQEFMAYLPNDDNAKFTELYGVYRLKSKNIPDDSHVYISTIQRLYAVLKGEDLEESLENENPNEKSWQPKQIPPIAYNEKLPIDFFDFVVIDECHRSIYNLWRQVLDYFDAFQIGLTATPDNRTFAYFQQNIVSQYSHEMAVADGVNVGYDVFLIDTKISQKGATLWKGEYIEKREKLTRQKYYELQDEDEAYSRLQLDKDVVNPNQIRLIMRTFKEQMPALFPDRVDEKGNFEMPKTLVFAKTDSHADDIINIVREEFNEENRFCKKITYNAQDAKSVLADFRGAYYPRIAVTVDMIATGTDVKPLECLLFMRDVKSRNYFEQMKGRGTRTVNFDDLKKVSPTAQYTKDHFVIVDAIGVTQALKTDSRPLERKPSVPLKDLLSAVAVGARDEDLFLSLANRLTRLDKQLNKNEKQGFEEITKGVSISQVVKDLLNAYNPDTIEDITQKIREQNLTEAPEKVQELTEEALEKMRNQAAKVFTGALNDYIENIRKAHEQKIDLLNPDEVLFVGWSADQQSKATQIITDFQAWIAENKDEIVALQLIYAEPQRRQALTLKMMKELAEQLRLNKPTLTTSTLWQAYKLLEQASEMPKNEIVALVSLLRKAIGVDNALTAYDKTIDRNFQKWVFEKQAGKTKFTTEQMDWLRLIKEHITTSMRIEADDLDYTPFDARGGVGKMYQLFGNEMNDLMNEINTALVA